MRTFRWLVRLAICSAMLTLAFGIARAATLTVTTLVDTDDSICDSSCSLRDAIVAAAPGDTIIFAPELRGGNIQLTKTLLIDKRVSIDGPNVRRISITGNQTFRVININIPTGSRVVMLDGLIIRKGGAPNGDGGGIQLDPDSPPVTISMTNCSVLDNTAMRGGGIFMNFGVLWVIDSTIANNTATANGSAGGIETFMGTLQIINSTISGNRSLGVTDGVGGIRFTGSPNWKIFGSTIAFNSTNGITATSAGGIAGLNGAPGPIWNTIIAKNTGIEPDLTGRIGGAANSFIGVADESMGLPDGVNGNIVGTPEAPLDPLLLPLADNGGSILTHALASQSRAINSGSNSLALDRLFNPETKDQRRFIRIANKTVDIGAYESGSQPLSDLSTIIGQVTRADGRGVAAAHVTVSGPNGESFFGITNPFGYYRVVNVPPNVVYSMEFSYKGRAVIHNIFAEESTENHSVLLD